MRPPLVIAVGDPAGVGPAVAIEAAVACADRGLALVGDAERLTRALGGRVATRRIAVDGLLGLGPAEIGVVDAGPVSDGAVLARAPTPEGGAHQLEALTRAAAAVREGFGRALVTGPTSKEAVVRSGVAFIGQTEHLARGSGLNDDDVTMMFLGARLRVALVTTHLSIARVPVEITPARVCRAARHLGEACRRLRPRGPIELVVAGLNPHAGEGGLFGDEEARVIAPAIEEARGRPPFDVSGIRLHGPRPAETAFRDAAAGRVDGVVAMYHDQGTIASKLLDWGTAVNVTWGLPFVRTSVDHGVAYDAAAGSASHDGMLAAVRLADRLTGGGGG